ncbi:MAG: signal peptidase II [Acidobacteria bacterium]|nr:signal peptidase II [Acidobacteriota bacterium]
MSGRRMGWRAGYLLAALGLYMVDQASKAWAVRSLRFGPEMKVIDGLLSFVYAENPGVAFGQLQEGGSFGRWFFVVLAGVAGVAVLYYFFRTVRNDDRILGACALLLAGIFGNLTDRVRLGFVIDFILVYYRSFHWPVFNVADACISFGALLLVYDMFVMGKQERREKREAAQALKVEGERVE